MTALQKLSGKSIPSLALPLQTHINIAPYDDLYLNYCIYYNPTFPS